MALPMLLAPILLLVLLPMLLSIFILPLLVMVMVTVLLLVVLLLPLPSTALLSLLLELVEEGDEHLASSTPRGAYIADAAPPDPHRSAADGCACVNQRSVEVESPLARREQNESAREAEGEGGDEGGGDARRLGVARGYARPRPQAARSRGEERSSPR